MSDGRAGRGKTRPDRLRASLKQIKALKMRVNGRSFDEIAEKLGYAGRSGAQYAVIQGLKKTMQEPADELRTLESLRLDGLFLVSYAVVQDENQPILIRLAAVDRCVRIAERRAKLNGLDAPTKVAPTDPSGELEYSGLPDAEIERELIKALAAAGLGVAGGETPALDAAGEGGAEDPAG